MAITSSPSSVRVPPVTLYFGWPAMAYASVDLPEPLGPMIAWGSPARTRRSAAGGGAVAGGVARGRAPRRRRGAGGAHARVGLPRPDRQVDAGEDVLALGAVGLDGDG